jgi:hypothetical protein
MGCSMHLPAVKPPRIDVEAAATGALEALDADRDGAISRDEANVACVGIANSWDRYDADGNGKVDQSELEARFKKWTDGDTGLMNLRVQVDFRGTPLTEAAIEMTPYAFLGPKVLPAKGETDQYGYAFVAIPKDLLPDSQQGTQAMQIGLYRVSITHPTVELAAKYNTETELSVDLSSSESNTGIRFRLK